MGTNNRKPRRKFTDEFKADAVKVWRESGDSKTAVAQRLGIDSTALGNWIKQADIDDGKRDGTTSEDKAKIAALEKELRQTRMERDFLKKATAFFAKESDK
jgi:transposase